MTRRSILRRNKRPPAKFYHYSNTPPPPVIGAMEAFEALNIATVNVISYTIFVTGGLLWAFDVRGIEDMRARVRKRIGLGDEKDVKDAEEEFEEWVAEILSRKEEKNSRRKRERRRKGEEDDDDDDDEEGGGERRGKQRGRGRGERERK